MNTQQINKEISADFPFESKYVTVKGSQVHYIDEGEGEPILFLHGNPTSSYLWRNIIPYLSANARCIAPDLIGMGKSDKPDINYGFFDSYEYIDGFIEQLGLKNITLVLHDWGSALGFHYANLHRENIRGIVFMESVVRAFTWQNVPSDVRLSFRLMRTPGIGWVFVNWANLFIKKMLPNLIKRKLTQEELQAYAEPYQTIKSRKPLRRWPEDIPISGKPANVAKAVKAYQVWLQESNIPKLFFYVTPGAANKEDVVTWIKENLRNTKLVYLGEGLHFIQEDYPHEIGMGISQWIETI